MNFREGLDAIAARFGLDADAMARYAEEDTIGGFGGYGVSSAWSGGGIWEVEGKTLYALIRAIKPARVLEIGVAQGCSTTHILSALDKNGSGELVSVDILANAGALVPQGLRERWRFVAQDAITFLTENKITTDFVFEDGLHERDWTEQVLRLILKSKPKYVLSHDAMHWSGYGANVRGAWQAVFGECDTILQEPSDCGLAYKVLM